MVKDLREAVGLTQAELAQRAGTSQPTIAAYESGSKSPTLRTLTRLAAAAGHEAMITFVPALTREDRRSLALHRAIAVRLSDSPVEVLEVARDNLKRMRRQHPHARELLDEWVEILDLSVHQIVSVLQDPGLRARALRQVTPFAGVLNAAERTDVYSEFRKSEARR